ncbi:MAG: alpha/beta fold hydrolase [Acetobacteraceae bacterium]|nr:alpha/beta fold hydrolase [Acetobacteraceae bacterium]
MAAAPAPDDASPEAVLAALEGRARRHETPCGDGAVVWREWGPRGGGGGTERPLVLFHGGSGSWRHWVRNVERLSADRRLLCPDLPGLGESAMPPRADGGPAPIAAVLRAGLARVLGEGAPFDLAGFSFGALIAGHVAAEAGPELRSVTLVGAASLGLLRQRTDLVKVRDKEGEARVAAHRHNLASLMFADPARIDGLALLVQERNTREARFRSRGFAGTALLRDAIARSRAPVALVYGERDAIAWPEVEARFAVLRSVRPDAWTGMVPGAGHWVSYEAAPAFDAMLLDMLDRRRGG